MDYFFLAAAFFRFICWRTVDHVSIHLAFVCSAVSIFLVISYAAGCGDALRDARSGVAQFIYLVAFSYAFFLKGFTGLAI
jgi:hypothetical protein